MCLLLLFCLLGVPSEGAGYWQTQRKGANCFNQTPSEKWFVAAKSAGIELVRLAPDRWESGERDFLIGNADAYKGLSLDDLQKLKEALDHAEKYEIKVVLTLLSLPGSRWKQNNKGIDDLRIWENREYREQAIQYWGDLAKELKDHPALVGYNILNEPHPEKLWGKIGFRNNRKFLERGGRLLSEFYENIIGAIREVDPHTPIVLDTGLHATPWAIEFLHPLPFPNLLYSFHMYEPYRYTTRRINQGRFAYPGTIPNPTLEWDKGALEEFFRPISIWQEKHNIPASQIFVGEFGCDRTAQGAERYLGDLIEIFNEKGWHWAFYAFREDVWDSMDYELGSGRLSWGYWKAVEERGDLSPFRTDGPIFQVLLEALK